MSRFAKVFSDREIVSTQQYSMSTGMVEQVLMETFARR